MQLITKAKGVCPHKKQNWFDWDQLSLNGWLGIVNKTIYTEKGRKCTHVCTLHCIFFVSHLAFGYEKYYVYVFFVRPLQNRSNGKEFKAKAAYEIQFWKQNREKFHIFQLFWFRMDIIQCDLTFNKKSGKTICLFIECKKQWASILCNTWLAQWIWFLDNPRSHTTYVSSQLSILNMDWVRKFHIRQDNKEKIINFMLEARSHHQQAHISNKTYKKATERNEWGIRLLFAKPNKFKYEFFTNFCCLWWATNTNLKLCIAASTRWCLF